MADAPDTNSYRNNTRGELTNATATVFAAYRYGYDFDDIGNRKTSAERGTNSVYTARHELRHAIDYCKKKNKKPFTCDEEICSEINAYSSVDCAQLSGDLKTDCVKSHVKRSAKKYAGCAGKKVDEMVDLAVDNGACE